jgi:hypothetical protein
VTITVRTASELSAALQKLTEDRVDRAVAVATREVAVYCFEQWTAGKFTWSRWQTRDVWSGQSRASVNVSVGSPDRSYAPDNPGDWPLHGAPYPARDPFEARFALEGLRPYQMVFVSDAAPHAAKVEQHTQVAHMAAGFSKAHFAPGYSWAPIVTASASVPF